MSIPKSTSSSALSHEPWAFSQWFDKCLVCIIHHPIKAIVDTAVRFLTGSHASNYDVDSGEDSDDTEGTKSCIRIQAFLLRRPGVLALMYRPLYLASTLTCLSPQEVVLNCLNSISRERSRTFTRRHKMTRRLVGDRWRRSQVPALSKVAVHLADACVLGMT